MATAAQAPAERKVNKVDPAKVKSGDIMACIAYVKVKAVQQKGDVLVVNDLTNGVSEFNINGRDLVEACLSADQFSETQKVTMTAAAEILVTSHNTPFTVCFEKQDGTERVLRGRLISHEALLGRSKVEDLDTTDAHRMRLVDHRTIKWLVVNGVKYVVK